ncbi:MAG: hypothetical protein PHU51_05690 [Candidatus Nanoarchaeia archaeon]|nr:hypothetical protein [Candidatus Nanoarchaeia archaeon]
MTDQTPLYEKKMQILLGLGFSVVKINDTQALWKINSTASITADVTVPSKHWEVNYKGSKICDWSADSGLPASTRGMIQSFEEDFIKACAGVGIIFTPEDVGSIESTQGPIEAPAPNVKAEGPTEEVKPVDNISELINALRVLIETPTNPGFTRTRGFEVSAEVKTV